MLEHQALFPQQSGQSKPLNFFTLYMGISTRVSELEQYYKGFIEVTEKVTMRIPMFQKWVFRLNYKNAVKKHRYRYNESESGGFNVYFVQSSNDADKYECTFTNDQGASKRSIDVPKDCITLNPATDIKYKTVREVPVYKKNARGTIVGRAIATLNAEINFTSLNEYTEDYYEVVVYNSECKKYEEPVLSGWVAGAGKQGGSAPLAEARRSN